MVGGGVDTNLDVEPLGDVDVAAARRTVCRYAIGDTVTQRAADARALLLMLGLAEPVATPPGDADTDGEPVADGEYVDVGPVRDHIAALHGAKMTYRQISERVQITVERLNRLRTRPDPVPVELADRIRAIPVPDATPTRKCATCGEEFRAAREITRCQPCIHGLTPAGPAREHIATLRQQFKWGTRRIAEAADVSRETVVRIASGECTHTSRLSAERICAIPLPDEAAL